MSRAPRVTVAGAGVLGLSTALALADCGCEVRVCDPGGPNASSIAAGMLAPVFEAVLDASARPHLELLMLARDLWPGLAQRAGIVIDRSGTLAVGEEAWLARVAAGFAAIDQRPMQLGGAAARGLAPGLSDRIDEALLSREDWRLDAPGGLGALAAAATAAGVIFERRIVRERGDADLLVIATGAKSELLGTAPELAHLAPIKGHIVRVAAPSGGATVRGEQVYAAPGSGLAFGATMEAGRDDVGIEEEMAMPLLAAGLRLFPGLRGAPVQMAAGVRAATPDGLPMAGWSATPGVLLAVGSRRNGWLLAPLVATLVAAQAMGRDVGPYGAALDPGRFGGRG